MKVVDHEPHVWFLLEEAGRYFMDARVSRSAVEWSVLLELTPEELDEYQAMGKTFLHKLAARIESFPDQYADRNLSTKMDSAVLKAIQEWQSARDAHGSSPA